MREPVAFLEFFREVNDDPVDAVVTAAPGALQILADHRGGVTGAEGLGELQAD